ncbi:dTDP-4-dehydrorhamnose reductase [Cohnella terricola]|nr:dTDP-4-dehydrorhamnose reductase [Cohnella terricola]
MVTGAGGQLGEEIVRLKGTPYEIIGLDRLQLDVTDAAQCMNAVASIKPDIILHAAAYTAVDQAESEPEAAWMVNVAGTSNMAKSAEAVGAKFCYISTDYVFNGNGREPYREDDLTEPQTVYGKTKLEGEQAAVQYSSKSFIVRTSWVYGKYGNNFVKTMLKLASERSSVSVVHDQIGSPTYTYDLGRFLIELVQTEAYGIYHASNAGKCTWYEFAQAIFEENQLSMKVEACTTEDFPRPAPRPLYSVMDHSAIRQNGFTDLRPWREGLQAFLKELNS